MIILLPYLYILILSLAMAAFLHRHFSQNKTASLLISLVNTPILVSLTTYCLYFFLPNKPILFYLSFYFFLLLLLLTLTFKDILALTHSQFSRPKSLPKIVFLLVVSILILSSLRIWFWPINWDDQIYYIEQSYSIGQDRNMERFLDWGFFKNDQLQFQINPSIRPGLPLLYSLSGLFSPLLQTSVNFSRIITFHYFNLLLLLLIFLGRKNKLIAVFLTLTCYLFINLSVLGFKELILTSQVLLIVHLISSKSKLGLPEYSLIGILFGLMAYINYSGSFISGIFILLIFFFTKNKFIVKTLYTFLLVTLLIVFSGLELIYFIGITLDGGFRRIDIPQQTVSIIKLISSKARLTSSPQIKLDTSGISQNNTGKGELLSYDIHNGLEIYTKGKLQGFFQFQYFGLVFVFFGLTVLFRFKSIIANSLTKHLLLFLGFFYLIYLDILNLNHHQFATVLSISHKYSAMLVPLLSIIIASQWSWWQKIFQKLNYVPITLTVFVTTLLIISIPDQIANFLMFLTNIFIPLHDSQEYYRDVIQMALRSIEIISCLYLFLIGIFLIKYKNQLSSVWAKHHCTATIFLIAVFYLPFLFFFHTNFGLDNTLLYSFSSTATKLSHIKGWESLYTPVNFINSRPHSSKLLFVNCNLNQLGIHFSFPVSNIYTINPDPQSPTTDITKSIKDHQINYLIVPPHQYQFPQFKLVQQTSNFAIYQIPLSD